ncbi:MAG TPA: radical SAM protein, partial [Candidatus Dormibacteraeota bacterium]|nr:radical SAM protein [Candidatus Dormibacteraeota bacterium]
MSTVAVNPISSKPPGTVPADHRVSADGSRPVVKPKRSAFQLLGEVLAHGGPGYLQFAITNICNAKCDFCGFAVDRFDAKQRRSVTLQEARDVIDIAVKNH